MCDVQEQVGLPIFPTICGWPTYTVTVRGRTAQPLPGQRTAAPALPGPRIAPLTPYLLPIVLGLLRHPGHRADPPIPRVFAKGNDRAVPPADVAVMSVETWW